MNSAFRRAVYRGELLRAVACGLCPHSGFRGLAVEVGVNPPLDELRDALDARIELAHMAEVARLDPLEDLALAA